jgi:hypothetical protein
MFIYRAGETLFITPGAGRMNLSPYDMDPMSRVVGRFINEDDPSTSRAFLLDANSLVFTELGQLPGVDTSGVNALAISDDGTKILGEARNYFDGVVGHTRRPVLWTDGGGPATDIGLDEIVFTNISGINNNGDAVGSARIQAGPVEWRGYARLDGAWIDIGGFGGGRTDARAINNHGVVTGNSRFTPTQSFAFRWSLDMPEMEMLRPPFGLSNAVGRDINDEGTVVGSSSAGSSTRAVYWRPGSVFGINLNDFLPANSGWDYLATIERIDSCGVVVGQGVRSDRRGYFSGFIAVLPPYDEDADGLADCWEVNGLDLNGDGTVDLDLPAMGADPMRKDLFVEIDAMTGRAPAPNVIQRVAAAFANAPVTNLDGSTGITLHAFVDETSLPRRAYPNAFDDFEDDKRDRFGTPAERSSTNAAMILAAKRLAFRYCIFADTYSGGTSSGLAELGGNDLMVTLGGWSTPGGTPDQQAGTFMHELGHTIGLRHGGGDATNYKPNYYSVMSYAWQTPHAAYASSWRLDYSRVDLPDLDEGLLFEDAGLGGAPGDLPDVLIPFRATDGTLQLRVSDGNEPMDWDNSLDIELLPTMADLNHHTTTDPGSPGEILTGHDDWANLVYNFRLSPSFADGVHETVDELTFEEFADVESQFASGNPCGPADIAPPTGTLDLADLVAFVEAFTAMDPSADLAEPEGLFDLADIVAFVTAFNAGCP